MKNLNTVPPAFHDFRHHRLSTPEGKAVTGLLFPGHSKPIAAVRCGVLPARPWPRSDVAARLREARKNGLTVQRFDGARVYTPTDARNPYTFFILTGPEVQNASSLSLP